MDCLEDMKRAESYMEDLDRAFEEIYAKHFGGRADIGAVMFTSITYVSDAERGDVQSQVKGVMIGATALADAGARSVALESAKYADTEQIQNTQEQRLN